MRSAQSLIAAMIALSLAACATLSGEWVVYVDVGGDDACVVTIGARAYALPAQADALALRLRRLGGRRASALMSPRPALTSPGCWDEAVAIVRAAGFRRIGFFSEEPEPPQGRVG